jgi:uncharacterized protein
VDGRHALKMKNIKSPCIGHCKLDEQRICLGCFRSAWEIKTWPTATDNEKQVILNNCDQRQAVKQDHILKIPDVVISPCKKLCKMVDEVCVGCQRTMDEIASWTYCSPNEKREIIMKCERRKTEKPKDVPKN